MKHLINSTGLNLQQVFDYLTNGGVIEYHSSNNEYPELPGHHGYLTSTIDLGKFLLDIHKHYDIEFKLHIENLYIKPRYMSKDFIQKALTIPDRSLQDKFLILANFIKFRDHWLGLDPMELNLKVFNDISDLKEQIEKSDLNYFQKSDATDYLEDLRLTLISRRDYHNIEKEIERAIDYQAIVLNEDNVEEAERIEQNLITLAERRDYYQKAYSARLTALTK